MKYLIILILVFVNGLIFGQDTKKIVNYFNNSKEIIEEYYVIKGNKNIKHGEYIKYYLNNSKNNSNKYNCVQKRGFYYQDQLDSIWTYYEQKEHKLIKEEFYNKGKKVGIWKTYMENGVIKQFDYKLNREIEPLISLNFRYPKYAVEMGIEGVIEIKVVYNKDCSADTIFVFKSLDSILDKNSMEIVTTYEKLRGKYSLLKDCSSKHDTIYSLKYKLQ